MEKNENLSHKGLTNKKEDTLKKIMAFIISVICIIQINKFIQINNINIRFSNSILSIFIFVSNMFFVYKYIKDTGKDKRLDLVSLIFGFVLSFSVISGKFLEYERTIISSRYLVSLLFFSISLAGVSKILFKATIKAQHRQTTVKNVVASKKRFIIYFLIIFICYIPIFLAYYPTIFAYDVQFQLNEMLHHNNTLHHPLIHTLFIYVCYKFGIVIGSVGIGMAIYSIIQMLIMSLIFSYFLNYMHEKGINKKIIYASLVFFAIFPVNSILSLSTTKDVIFSGLFLLTFIKFCEFIDSKKITFKWIISYIIILVFMLLFRNNAIYALFLAIPLMLFFNKNNRKEWIILNTIGIIFFSIIYSTMAYALDAKPTEKSERLSIPIQQIARVYVEKEEELDKKTKKEIETFFKCDIKKEYIPFFADPIKANAKTEYFEDNIPKFLKLWGKLGLKYPGVYIDAFLFNTMGFWYIDDETHSYIYGEGLKDSQGYLLTDHKTIDAEEQVPRHSYFPKLKECLEKLFSENTYRDIPIVSLMFNLATYSFIMLYYILICIYQKKYKELLPMALVGAYFGTILLGPVAIIRYMYPIVIISPLLIGIILRKEAFIEE